MGASLKNIRNLALLISRNLLPQRASILEYGPQQISWSSFEQELELKEFVKSMRVFNGLSDAGSEALGAELTSGGLMADVFEQCGFLHTSIDISPYGKNVILFDLNVDTVPSSLRETFDLVTNFGTTEHILNQYNCFATVHDFTKLNGLMYHDLPMGGYFFHGYFSCTPMLFFHLANANDYEILYRHYWKAPGNGDAVTAPSEMTDHGWPEGWFQDWGIEFVFRKTTTQPFRLPVEIGTSGPLDEAFLNRAGPEMRLIAGADSITPSDGPPSRVRRVLMSEDSPVAEQSEAPDTIHSNDSTLVGREIYDLAYPTVDLETAPDPIAAIIGSPEFNSCAQFFAGTEAITRALVGPISQALLYCTVRSLRPDHVVEIGTYKASTTEAICRALRANGRGIVHTVDPYGDVHGVDKILGTWPTELREHVRFYPVNSMAFYIEAIQTDLRPHLVFVDGHHDYEFALFDIQCAARLIRPNGFIFIDNIAQPGPYFAARDFLKIRAQWQELGSSMSNYRPEFAFDQYRTTLQNTDFCILRAPRQVFVGIEPLTPGTSAWQNSKVDSISISIVRPATGKLHVQCILRSFGEPWTEATFERSIEFTDAIGEVRVPLDIPCRPELLSVPRSVEPWLTWEGDAPLELMELPILHC
jgi:hypothetical protein